MIQLLVIVPKSGMYLPLHKRTTEVCHDHGRALVLSVVFPYVPPLLYLLCSNANATILLSMPEKDYIIYQMQLHPVAFCSMFTGTYFVREAERSTKISRK